MASQQNLTGLGVPAALAQLTGFPPITAVTAAGTTTSDATVIKKQQRVLEVTGSGSDGVRLPDDADLMVPYFAYAKTGNMKVYPPTGAAFNADTADQSQTVAANLAAVFLRTGNLTWISLCGAVVPA